MPISSSAYDEVVDLKKDGEYIYSDTKGIISDDRVYVPVRYAAKPLGIEDISWTESENEVRISDGETELILYTGSKTAYINGKEHILENPPFIYNSRTYIPIRFIAELFGSKIFWEEEIYAVNIENDIEVSKDYISNAYSDEDIYWLARIIEAESKGEPMEGKIAVGNVVINRKESKDFPDSVYEVIFEKTKGKYQFTPVKNKTVYNNPSKESITAAKLALNNTDIAGDALYFLNPETTSSSWVKRNRKYYITINNHDFYL